MGRFSKATSLIFLFTALTFAFQNCGELQTLGDDELSSNLFEPCTGSSCRQSREGILLKIANDPVILLYSYPNMTKDSAFDVSGFCDNGGYPETRIAWALQGATGTQGPVQGAIGQVRCDALGRFQFRVNLPANYNYERHLLVVTLFGVDEFGNQVDNPLTLNNDSRSVELFRPGVQ